MALRDPKVLLFGLLMATELLGLSFLQFFPTSAFLYVLHNFNIESILRLTKSLKYNTTNTLLIAAYVIDKAWTSYSLN